MDIISKLVDCKEAWVTVTQKSFLSDEFKKKYAELLMEREGFWKDEAI